MRKSMHDFGSRKVSRYSMPGTGQERVGTELRTFMPQAVMEVMMMTVSQWGEGPPGREIPKYGRGTEYYHVFI
jgi:hypothetical protein